MATTTQTKPIDWTDPKWSNPLVHISSTGSFLEAEASR